MRCDAEAADLAECRRALAQGSRTFLAASYLLPRAVRDDACALYAFCRMADDAIDAIDAPHDALQRLRARLDAVYRDAPQPRAGDRAFARVVQRHGLPRVLPEALLEGFAWDADVRRYETLAELHDYAARVAGSVGAMMAVLMGARGTAALARACDLGVAMQLSNIARDVGEDAAMGRLYLPRAWLREAGLDPDAWLARPHAGPALAAVVGRLLDDAERLYRRSGVGVAALPPSCRPGIDAARRLYREIGRQVARDGLNPLRERARVRPARKLAVLAAALALPRPAGDALDEPPLAAVRFLVEAAERPVPAAPPPWWQLTRRVGAQIELFERLERRDVARLRVP